MRYIETLKDGDSFNDIYFCKKKHLAQTKNGKDYYNVTLQDKTGSLDCKIWDINSEGINEFDEMDYIQVHGDVSIYNGALQGSIRRLQKAAEGSYDESEYLPMSSYDIDEMYEELLKIIATVEEPHLNQLLVNSFEKNETVKKRFKKTSAAKTVHHAFVGGLLEHTLSVTRMCDFIAAQYDYLDRDLLLTAAIFHDIGKIQEFSDFPQNDYTDDGQLLGHIVMGYNYVASEAAKIEGFPKSKKNELLHCILSHHGKLEFGSPKVPAIAEAFALNFADDMDAKLETMKERLGNVEKNDLTWQGYVNILGTNIRKTSDIF